MVVYEGILVNPLTGVETNGSLVNGLAVGWFGGCWAGWLAGWVAAWCAGCWVVRVAGLAGWLMYDRIVMASRLNPLAQDLGHDWTSGLPTILSCIPYHLD